MHQKTIDYSGKNRKVLKVIMDEYPFIGYSYLRKILRTGDIKVNGKRIKEDIEIYSGDTVEFFYVDRVEEPPKIVYEDENIVIFYKPKKIASTGENSFEKVIHNYVNANYILCHRLDTNTDGLLIFAKSLPIFEEIKALFKNRLIEKHYIAEVVGHICENGIFRDYLIKSEKESRVYVYTDKKTNSLEAVLEFKVISRTDKTSVLDVKPITGRTHQIRAQLAFHGYPIVGDGKYGNETTNRELGISRQKLTAYKLIFHADKGKLKYLQGKEIILG